MKKLFLLALSATTLLSACVMDPSSPEQGELTMPLLTPSSWQVKTYQAADGSAHFCSLSPGYNAIEVIVRKSDTEKTPSAVVHSTRTFGPSTQLLVSIGSRNYQTFEPYFPVDTSKTMIENMLASEKIYLRWSEVGTVKNGRDIYFNQISSKGFKAVYQGCKEALGLKGQELGIKE